MSQKLLTVVAVIGSLGVSACAPGRRATNPIRTSITANDKVAAQGNEEKSAEQKAAEENLIVTNQKNEKGEDVTRVEVASPDNKGKRVIEIPENGDKAKVTEIDGCFSEPEVEKVKENEGETLVNRVRANDLILSVSRANNLTAFIALDDAKLEFGKASIKTTKVSKVSKVKAVNPDTNQEEEKEETSVVKVVDEVIIVSKDLLNEKVLNTDCNNENNVCKKNEDGTISVVVVGLPAVLTGKSLSFKKENIQVNRNNRAIGIALNASVDKSEDLKLVRIIAKFSDERAANSKASTQQGEDKSEANKSREQEKQVDSKENQSSDVQDASKPILTEKAQSNRRHAAERRDARKIKKDQAKRKHDAAKKAREVARQEAAKQEAAKNESSNASSANQQVAPQADLSSQANTEPSKPSLTSRVKNRIGSAASSAGAYASSAASTVANGVNGAYTTARESAASAKDAVKNKVSSAYATAKESAASAKDAVKNKASSAYATAKESAASAKDAVKNKASSAYATAKNSAASARDAVSRKASEIANRAAEWARTHQNSGSQAQSAPEASPSVEPNTDG